MRYLPHTQEDIQKMLAVANAGSLDDLFKTIPDAVKVKGGLNLPEPMSEWELNDYMEKLASENIACKGYTCLIGAGSYDHYIPAIIPYLVSRSEFATAYTPTNSRPWSRICWAWTLPRPPITTAAQPWRPGRMRVDRVAQKPEGR